MSTSLNCAQHLSRHVVLALNGKKVEQLYASMYSTSTWMCHYRGFGFSAQATSHVLLMALLFCVGGFPWDDEQCGSTLADNQVRHEKPIDGFRCSSFHGIPTRTVRRGCGPTWTNAYPCEADQCVPTGNIAFFTLFYTLISHRQVSSAHVPMS